MYLLHTTELQLHHVIDHRSQEYGILSHTWGEEEVSFHDISSQYRSLLKGFQKIQKACELASLDNCQYIWIDTCCIDKSSSAELSEAINSMYAYYRNARCCYTYLGDFDRGEDGTEIDGASFRRSRWFRRGWTLQELLAPVVVAFYDRKWVYVGDKTSLKYDISLATGIEETYFLDHKWLPYASVATRMSWAAHRQTTRVEDEAYCLMGLFDVNMPLLYGEGQKAFQRLQHEIVRSIEDESLFAWHEPVLESGIFAVSPRSFAWSGDISPLSHPRYNRTPFTVTNRGLQLKAVYKIVSPNITETFDVNIKEGSLQSKKALLCPLNCAWGNTDKPFVIILEKKDYSNIVTRLLPGQHVPAPSFQSSDKLHRRTVYIKEPIQPLLTDEKSPQSSLSEISIPDGIHVWYVTPPGYVKLQPILGRNMYFTCVPAFAVITIEDTNRVSPVFILEHAVTKYGDYKILLQSLANGASVMESINSWRHTLTSSRDTTLKFLPVLKAEHLGHRKHHVNVNRQTKIPGEYGLAIYQSSGDWWRLELLPPD